MMRKVLLSIPPALSTLLFCAHLLYHGVPLAAAAAPLGALILLAVKGAGATRLLALLHVLFASEWARAGGKIVMRRLETGGSIHPALEIMAGVTLFTILAAWCSLAQGIGIEELKKAVQEDAPPFLTSRSDSRQGKSQLLTASASSSHFMTPLTSPRSKAMVWAGAPKRSRRT